MDANGHGGAPPPKAVAQITILLLDSGAVTQQWEGITSLVQHVGMLEVAKEMTHERFRQENRRLVEPARGPLPRLGAT